MGTRIRDVCGLIRFVIAAALMLGCARGFGQNQKELPAAPMPQDPACGQNSPSQNCRAQDSQQPPAPQENSPEKGPQNPPPKPPDNSPPENNPNQAPPSQGPSPSNNPPIKQEGNPNAAQSAAEKTKDLTLQAAEATKKLGEATLYKMRDWESGWLTGPYSGRSRPLYPLRAKERREIYLQQTLITPEAYMKRMFAAGIDQVRGSPQQWDDGWGGYAERFASREGQFIAANSLAALGNAALKYDPLYDECACSGFKARTRHAILRNFLTYNRTESELRPQWALFGGAFAGGVISTAWKPHPRNAFAEGGRAVLGQAGYGVLLNFFIEFAGDINRKLGARR